MDFAPAVKLFLQTVLYTGFGVLVFAFAFWVIVKVAPFSIRKEVEEDQNIALAVLIGAVILGLSIIISAALHG